MKVSRNFLIGFCICSVIIIGPVTARHDEIEDLIQNLGGDDTNALFRAAESLAKIGIPAVEPLLLEITDSDSSARRGAIEALGKIRDTRALEPLVSIVRDINEDPMLKITAIKALAHIRDVRSVESLIHALNDDNQSIRWYAAKALGIIGDTTAVEPLIKTLEDDSEGVRWNVVLALGLIKDPRALNPLIALLRTDPDEDVRLMAIDALGSLGDLDTLREPLVAAMHDRDCDVREEAADLLDDLEWKPKNSAEQIAYLIAEQDWYKCIELGPIATEPLIRMLHDKDDFVRSDAAETLNEIHDPLALPAFVEALTDVEIFEIAARALESFGWEPRSFSEKAHFMIAKGEIEAVQEMWEDVQKVIREDLLSRKIRTVQYAACFLLEDDEKEYIPELIEILEEMHCEKTACAYFFSDDCFYGEHNALREASKKWFSLNTEIAIDGGKSDEAEDDDVDARIEEFCEDLY